MKKGFFLIATLCLALVACKPARDAESLIYKVKKAELGTVEYTVRQIIRNSDETWQLFGDRKVLFSCKATMKAGIDLQKVTEDDIQVHDKSVHLALPHAQVQTVNIQPSDIHVAYSKVSFLRQDYSQQEYDAILRAGEYSIKADQTIRQSLLADAEQNAREFFELMLRAQGFEEIDIIFK